MLVSCYREDCCNRRVIKANTAQICCHKILINLTFLLFLKFCVNWIPFKDFFVLNLGVHVRMYLSSSYLIYIKKRSPAYNSITQQNSFTKKAAVILFVTEFKRWIAVVTIVICKAKFLKTVTTEQALTIHVETCNLIDGLIGCLRNIEHFFESGLIQVYVVNKQHHVVNGISV